MIKHIKKPLSIFFLITLVLYFTNYVPGTYLTGWDNLQTELSPLLGVKRAFFSVWQEYQSFGLLAGMAHGADLVRSLLVVLLSTILPQSLIRYVTPMLGVMLAGWGMYRLFADEVTAQHKQFAYLAGLFYMLNIGAVQIMFLPFESFTVFLAALPWLIWIYLRIMRAETPNKNDYLLFFAINLASTPLAVSQQLFVVYAAVLGFITAGNLIQKRSATLLKRAVALSALVLVINSFWLLPQLYFLKTSSTVVQTAKANQLSTQDILFANREKGTLRDVALMEGFFYERFNSQSKPLFQEWMSYRENPAITVLLLILAAIPLIGLCYKSRNRLSFGLICVLVLTALLINTPPFDAINALVRQNALINQIFRSPFTKFIIPYSLVASYFFANGALLLSKRLSKLTTRDLSKTTAVVFSALILVTSAPAFTGNYLSRDMKTAIPQEYHDVINYLQNIDANKRIALLPDYTFWGWFFHNWGYNGSGFLWYGIKQPIVSRTFDVWSSESENYFWEAKAAVEAEDVARFENVLEKYNIDYLLLDKTLRPVTSHIKALQYERLETLFNASAQISVERQWGNLTLYKVYHAKPINAFVTILENAATVAPPIQATNHDTAYEALGDYILDENAADYYYPYRDFFTQTRLAQKNWFLKETSDSFLLTAPLPSVSGTYTPVIADNQTEATLVINKMPRTFISNYTAYTRDNTLQIAVDKALITSVNVTQATLEKCGPLKGSSKLTVERGQLIVSSQDGSVDCFAYAFPQLDQKYGYLVKIQTKNLEGRRLFFSIADRTKQQAITEDRLRSDNEYYLIDSKLIYGLGYTMIFQNNSYKNIPSVNEVIGLEVYLFPTDMLKQIHFIRSNAKQKNPINRSAGTVNKRHYFLYEVAVDAVEEPSDNDTLVLYQSYHPGWKAYTMPNDQRSIRNTYFPFLFGQELTDHVKVNNWANGWRLSAQNAKCKMTACSIIILFWPQYLQFIGFGLVAIALVVVLRYRSTQTHPRGSSTH